MNTELNFNQGKAPEKKTPQNRGSKASSKRSAKAKIATTGVTSLASFGAVHARGVPSSYTARAGFPFKNPNGVDTDSTPMDLDKDDRIEPPVTQQRSTRPTLSSEQRYRPLRTLIKKYPDQFVFADERRLVDQTTDSGLIEAKAIKEYIATNGPGADELRALLPKDSISEAVTIGKRSSFEPDADESLEAIKKKQRSDKAKEKWQERKGEFDEQISLANTSINQTLATAEQERLDELRMERFQEERAFLEQKARESRLEDGNELQISLDSSLSVQDLETLEATAKKLELESNQQLERFIGQLDDFFLNKIQGPTSAMIALNGLKEAANFKRTKTQTRIASFTTSLLEYTKANEGKTPEVHLSLVKQVAPSPQPYSLVVSGNDHESNAIIDGVFSSGGTLASGYRNTIRPFHIHRRTGELTAKAKHVAKKMAVLGGGDRKEIMTTPLPGLNVSLSQLAWNDQANVFCHKKKVYSEKDLLPRATQLLVKYAHSLTKTSSTNKKRKSAKLFLQENFLDADGQNSIPTAALLPVFTAQNQTDIHAESAILSELIENADQTMLLVAGTKVACTACQTFYTRHQHVEHIGNYTSYAWLSKSSMEQLGFKADQVQNYLLEIYKRLRERQQDMLSYEGSNGTFKDEQLDFESDDSDSEDEAARVTVARYDKAYLAIAKQLLNSLKNTN